MSESTKDTTPPAIRTVALTKTYGGLIALDELNLSLKSGDVFGFIGPNGAGKSTTMKILCGLLQPTSGEAYVLGKSVADNGQFVRQNVGYMPDAFGVYDDLTVTEYLDFFASAYGLPRARRRKVVGDVLELTDLSYKRDSNVDALSRGMQQRLGLARVLVHDPPILLLDEPASGLDPRARIEIRELLKELQKMGKTILISSHILSELGEFCNKLGIIERGKLLVSGTIEDLVRQAGAGTILCIETLKEDADRAAEVLKSHANVESVQSVQTETNGNISAELLVKLRDASQHHHVIIEQLAAANIRLHSVAPQELKLEDVFLRLTRGAVQ